MLTAIDPDHECLADGKDAAWLHAGGLERLRAELRRLACDDRAHAAELAETLVAQGLPRTALTVEAVTGGGPR